MAGRPKLRALAQRIEKEGGDDVVLDLIRDGETISAVGERFGVSRGLILQWAKLDEDRHAAYEAAKRESAESLADRATKLHEDLSEVDEPMPGKVSATKNAADHLMRLAAIRDRDVYGDGPTGAQAIESLGAAFLAVLRDHGRVDRAAEHEALPVAEADWTLDEEEGDDGYPTDAAEAEGSGGGAGSGSDPE